MWSLITHQVYCNNPLRMSHNELEAVMQSIITSHRISAALDTEEAWWTDTSHTSSSHEIAPLKSGDTLDDEQTDRKIDLFGWWCRPHHVPSVENPRTPSRTVTLYAFSQEEIDKVLTPQLSVVLVRSALWTWLPPRTKHVEETRLSTLGFPAQKKGTNLFSCFRIHKSTIDYH